MKYMGNKRVMLQNGLGTVLETELAQARRFVDLFTGSGSVAIHVATKYSIPVLAVDLQSYSKILVNAVLLRDDPLNVEKDWALWKECSMHGLEKETIPESNSESIKWVKEARKWCALHSESITRAYGGHYFSPKQAMTIDSFLGHMPEDGPLRAVAHSAIIEAASNCAASPGHTAQPFQPTATAKKFLFEAWSRDVVAVVEAAFRATAAQYSKMVGEAKTADALTVSKNDLVEGDLCFLDPPYSGVHYSRFYHVLESVANGLSSDVSGVGRYPEPALRPKSDFSLRSRSASIMDDLLSEISKAKASAIVTFPDHDCSNGLSGSDLREIASRHFVVKEKVVKSKFSSLGGNSLPTHRSARVNADELILVLKPRISASGTRTKPKRLSTGHQDS